jgi:hypothetical protein
MKKITTIAAEAMEEMKDNNLPVEKFVTNNDGSFDYLFSRGLSGKEQKKAREIAEKYVDTKYTFFDELPEYV